MGLQNLSDWIDWRSLVAAVVGGIVALGGDWILVERRAELDVRAEYVAKHQEEIRRYRQLARIGGQKGPGVRLMHLSADPRNGAEVDTTNRRVVTVPTLVLDSGVRARWRNLRNRLKATRDKAPPVLVKSFDRLAHWTDRHPLPTDSTMRLPTEQVLERIVPTAWADPDSLARWYSLNAELEGRADGLLSLDREPF